LELIPEALAEEEHQHGELFKYIVLKLKTFVLKICVSTFWAPCSQYKNKMVRKENLNWVYLTTFSLVVEISNVNTDNSSTLQIFSTSKISLYFLFSTQMRTSELSLWTD